MSVDTHSLGRVVHQITIGAARDLEKRRAELAPDSLGEIEHQFQIPISGTATETVVWAETELTFDVEFYQAQMQRDSPLNKPTFTSGVIATIPGETIVGFCCDVFVSAWIEDERAITGAKVRIGVYVPAGSDSVVVDGYVHVAFQGYGAPVESDPGALDVGT